MKVEVRDDLCEGIDVFVDPDQLMHDLSYDSSDTTALDNHSGLVFYYGELAARAENQVQVRKHMLDQTEARVDKDYRNLFLARKEKVTEARLEKEITLSPDVIEAKSAYHDAKYVQNLLSSVVDAMEHRRSMMLQSYRTKYQGSVSE
jgi:predicted component of type VI protein secretion system